MSLKKAAASENEVFVIAYEENPEFELDLASMIVTSSFRPIKFIEKNRPESSKHQMISQWLRNIDSHTRGSFGDSKEFLEAIEGLNPTVKELVYNIIVKTKFLSCMEFLPKIFEKFFENVKNNTSQKSLCIIRQSVENCVKKIVFCLSQYMVKEEAAVIASSIFLSLFCWASNRAWNGSGMEFDVGSLLRQIDQTTSSPVTSPDTSTNDDVTIPSSKTSSPPDTAEKSSMCPSHIQNSKLQRSSLLYGLLSWSCLPLEKNNLSIHAAAQGAERLHSCSDNDKENIVPKSSDESTLDANQVKKKVNRLLVSIHGKANRYLDKGNISLSAYIFQTGIVFSGHFLPWIRQQCTNSQIANLSEVLQYYICNIFLLEKDVISLGRDYHDLLTNEFLESDVDNWSMHEMGVIRQELRNTSQKIESFEIGFTKTQGDVTSLKKHFENQVEGTLERHTRQIKVHTDSVHSHGGEIRRLSGLLQRQQATLAGQSQEMKEINDLLAKTNSATICETLDSLAQCQLEFEERINGFENIINASTASNNELMTEMKENLTSAVQEYQEKVELTIETLEPEIKSICTQLAEVQLEEKKTNCLLQEAKEKIEYQENNVIILTDKFQSSIVDLNEKTAQITEGMNDYEKKIDAKFHFESESNKFHRENSYNFLLARFENLTSEFSRRESDLLKQIDDIKFENKEKIENIETKIELMEKKENLNKGRRWWPEKSQRKSPSNVKPSTEVQTLDLVASPASSRSNGIYGRLRRSFSNFAWRAKEC
eukprot:GHVP01059377.1.p1 GENE.GHVP01059377.1~~GHVP01059377.1.p1  ORF type:complete len:766 (-),score=156.73 GHVP01059377.1:253-2550(-)